MPTMWLFTLIPLLSISSNMDGAEAANMDGDAAEAANMDWDEADPFALRRSGSFRVKSVTLLIATGWSRRF